MLSLAATFVSRVVLSPPGPLAVGQTAHGHGSNKDSSGRHEWDKNLLTCDLHLGLLLLLGNHNITY